MITRKDRKIANQKVMIDNRDKLIKYQEEKIAKLEAKLLNIKAMTEMNNYSYPEVFLRKINELARRVNQN